MSLSARKAMRTKTVQAGAVSGLIQQQSGMSQGSTFTVSLTDTTAASSLIAVFISGNTTVTTPANFALRRAEVNNMGHYLFTTTGGSNSWVFNCASGSITWWAAEIGNGIYDTSLSSNSSVRDDVYTTPSLVPESGTKLVLASIGSSRTGFVASTISGWTNGYNEEVDICQPSQDYPMQGVASKLVSADGVSSFNTTDTLSEMSNSLSAIIASFGAAGGGGLNQLPVASFSTANSGLMVTVDAAASTDPDGSIVSYAWNWGDGVNSTGVTTSHTYGVAGTYTVSLTVMDNKGAIATTTQNITVSAPGTPLNVIANPSAYGWPDATNTGPAPGTSFTIVPDQLTAGAGWEYVVAQGIVRVIGDGAHLQALDIRCPVIIDSSDVVIEDCIITCDGSQDDASDVIALRNDGNVNYFCERPIIRRCKLNGMLSDDHSLRARRCVSDNYGGTPGVVVEYCDMSGTGNLVTVEYEGIIRHNYCHGIGHRYSDHHSGLSNHGGSISLWWYHNTIDLRDTPTDPEIYPALPDAGGGLSSCTSIYSDFNHAQNITVEANLIANKDYSYAASGGNHGQSHDPLNPASNIKFINNRWLLAPNAYGYILAFDDEGPGNAWTGNVNDVDNSPAII